MSATLAGNPAPPLTLVKPPPPPPPPAAAPAVAPAADVVPGRTWIAILAAILGVFMAILDIQITNASLRDILGTLSATQEEGSWISTAYLAAEITAIPLTAFLARTFGIRAYMLANMSLFLVFSTLCGLAWNLPSMIVFRMMQGFTGGALIPTAMTLILMRLPLSKRAGGLALLMLATTLAPTAGPALGGWLTAEYGWPSIFYVNWVPGILMLLGVAYGLDREKMNLSLLWEADWLAIGSMAVGLVALIVFLEEGNSHDWFESTMIRVLFAVALAGIAGWIARALLRDKPFVNLRLFGRRNFLVASMVAATTGMGLYGSTFLLPLFLAQMPGYNSAQIGEVIMWMGLPQIIVMPFAAKFAQRFDNRIICTVGLILFAISCFLNSSMGSDTARDQLIVSQVFRAVGQPLVILTLSNFATNGIDMANLSSASSLFNMTRNLGGAIGTALLATLLTVRQQFHWSRIGESVSVFSVATQERLAQLTAGFTGMHGDAATASAQAVNAVNQLVRREAYVMAYNDCFFLMGIALLLSIAGVWMADRVIAGQR
jgi:DHA2 family multidrug resistance protein